MQITTVEGVTKEELSAIKAAEEARYKAQDMELGRLCIDIEGDELVVYSSPKTNIKRVRRITGYLSDVDNFNDAKRTELKDRVKHEVR